MIFPLYFNAISVLTAIGLLVTATALLLKASHDKIQNLRYLGFSYYLTLGLLIYHLFEPARFGIIFITGINYILLDMFVHRSFYRDRRSPLKILVGIHLLALILRVWINLQTWNGNYIWILDSLIANIANTLSFGWFGIAAHESYRRLKVNDINPLIWKRAAIIAYSQFVGILFFIPFALRVIRGNLLWDMSDEFNIISLSIQLMIISISVLGNYLAWVMPDWFKQIMIRKYHPESIEELTEEEIIRLMAAE